MPRLRRYCSRSSGISVIHVSDLLTNHSVQVCKRWNGVVGSSLLLNYLIELGREDLIDGDATIFTTNSRQRTLHDHCKAWRNLEPTSTETITCDIRPLRLCEASGSIFAWVTGKGPYSSLSLYEARSDILDRSARFWELKDLGTPFYSFYISQEEDLLVLMGTGQGSADAIDTPLPTVQIHLRSLNTGDPHPLAANSILYLYDTHRPTRSLNCQIMGDTIGILFSQWEWSASSTMLSVWKWTSGELLSCSTHSTIVSFAFVSDHAFVLPSHSSSGSCLQYYDFEPTHSPVQLAGTSSYAPRLVACFMLPDDGGSVETRIAPQIASGAPVISSQPHSSRRAGTTRRIPLSKKFHGKHRSALVAMQSACVDDGGGRHHFLLAVYANAFTDFVPREGCTVIPWVEWRDGTRIVLDSSTLKQHRREFQCNLSGDRIVVVHRHRTARTSVTVRVMDFNPIRFRSAISVSSRDSASDGHLDVAIDSSTRTSLVEKSDHWMKLALQGDAGIPFLETTMSGAFPLGIGAIILDEHLLVLEAPVRIDDNRSLVRVFKM